MTDSDRSNQSRATTRFWPPRRIHLIVAAGLSALLVVAVVAAILIDQLSRTAVPNLVGDARADAVSAIEDAELVYEPDGELSDAVCTTDPPLSDYCEVTSQSLKPQDRVRRGSTVALVLTVMEVSLPDFTGISFDDAASLATELHIRVKPENDVISNVAEHGSWTVTDQSRAANDVVDAETVVTLSLDAPLVDLPNIVGMPFQEAMDELAAAGIAGTYSSLPGAAANDRLFVRSTDPGPDGGQLPIGTEVTLQWGYKVPDVVGMSEGTAVSTLQEEGFKTDGASYGSDRVTGQTPQAGTVADPSKAVQLRLAPPTVVYEVTGDGSAAAITWIAPGTYDISQSTDARLPWRMTFETQADYRNFNAQILNGSTVTCTIYVNGELRKTNTSTGRFSVVSCG
ncbi:MULTISPECIES: MmpS family transport accessory protein [unclassified Microbacterium]|uniref:MmpS family transport accessory protein n=1 Tax=unclassified Microbacterium TaxID=2609290 RepID=UPI0021A45B34|nr:MULTISPECIES: MmpS family transport accessory protein [unclassified Microbacterium]MCT1364076.1 MmpS family transport accessory protein [Microbacterium sp. p3-SID131]MCT1375282.1 MmpS family transport accessory protein [Microbacterium sp. p3-SID337]